jgi:uncharacterized protein YecT (DUF1311 family)
MTAFSRLRTLLAAVLAATPLAFVGACSAAAPEAAAKQVAETKANATAPAANTPTATTGKGAQALAGLVPQGIWDVVGVRIDTVTGRRQAFGFNDERLVGRRFTFGERSIATNADEGDCHDPVYSTSHPDAGTAFAAAFGETAAGKPHRPADFKLPLAISAPVALIRIRCTPAWGGGAYDGGTPLIVTGAGTALLGWNDMAVLEIRRRADDAAPKPSFDCGKANGLVENSICHSVDLAGLDASLARAYARVVKFYAEEDPEKAGTVRKTQRDWLGQRARCGSDEACLTKQYAARIAQVAALGDDI